MADVLQAVTYVLRQEDSELKGEVTTNPADRGGRTRFGVAEKFHPHLTSLGFYDTLPYKEALHLAYQTYIEEYVNPLQIEKIESQDIANALLSFGINAGIIQATRTLQKALGLNVDGIFGRHTLSIVNSTPEIDVLNGMRQAQSKYYEAIVEHDPTQEVFLKGWLNRVEQNYTQVA